MCKKTKIDDKFHNSHLTNKMADVYCRQSEIRQGHFCANSLNRGGLGKHGFSYKLLFWDYLTI
jgi:hypothetical protein